MEINGMSQGRHGIKRLPLHNPGEEVVISGISGRFPESDSVKQLQENLFNKVDLVTADNRRWDLEHPEIPARSGKVNHVEKFDASFFGISDEHADTLDPLSRMLLEHTYEAIVDAGFNPKDFHGTKTGVIVASSFSESEDSIYNDPKEEVGCTMLGCSRAMLANRISQWLGTRGLSHTVDTACSSSLTATEIAYNAIKNGDCEAVLVGASNLCLNPFLTLQFSRLGVLSMDGICKTFDAGANGYVRSETISVFLLQKAKDAKRIYAQLVHAKLNCDGFKQQGITFPSTAMQKRLLEEFYAECEIDPSKVPYVEAHGTGTTVGDPEEVNAIDKVFCSGRSDPLLIGSVKSNLGHAEPACGHGSIAKVLIAMETGYIPPNLNFKHGKDEITALQEGRIKVVTEATPWSTTYAGINSFGFGGANAHILLKSLSKPKINGGSPRDDLPRLVVASGRTAESITTILDDLESRPADVEYIRLLHDIHEEETPHHLYRGYIIIPPRGMPETSIRSYKSYSSSNRPIWFLFSGFGSNYAGMGTGLLKLSVFTAAIQRCQAALKPYDTNVIDILTKNNTTTSDNTLNSVVGTVAVQIGLVDVLKSIGISPDFVIGHSLGELGCAYADGCLSIEETILSAYFRGLAATEAQSTLGSMAEVDLGYAKLKELCPSDIDIAFHDGPSSSTISGPADSVEKFLVKLQAMNILTKKVPSNNIAHHSRQASAAGAKLMNYLKKVIPMPKPRSNKWLSTSIPQSRWSAGEARSCSAEYHANNFSNPVLFEEVCNLLSKNAVVIEIGPQSLLNIGLKKSSYESISSVVLTKPDADDLEVLLDGIGQLYEVGLQPRLKNLYPEVQYPVSRGTPMISQLVRWDHAKDRRTSRYNTVVGTTQNVRSIKVDLSDDVFEYVEGHVIDGRILFPATGYLQLVWETIESRYGYTNCGMPVVFEDVKFLRATSIPKEGEVTLTLMIQIASGRFELIESTTTVVTGRVRHIAFPELEYIDVPTPSDADAIEDLTTKDIYKELRLRGYNYHGLFRGLKSANLAATQGHLRWTEKWVPFLDTMLQMKILGEDSRGLYVPTSIEKVVIDTKKHAQMLQAIVDSDRELPVYVDRTVDVITSGGVQIKGLKASAISRRKPAGDPVLETLQFVPHRDKARMRLEEIVRLASHIVLENQSSIKVKTIEVVDEWNNVPVETLTSPIIHEILSDLPLLQADVKLFAPCDKFSEEQLPPTVALSDTTKFSSENDAVFLIAHGLSSKQASTVLHELRAMMLDRSFLLAREPLDVGHEFISAMERENFHVILEKRTDKESLILFRRIVNFNKVASAVRISNDEFAWLPKLQNVLKAKMENKSGSNDLVIVFSERDFESGIVGLVNCLRKEPNGEIVRGVFVQDSKAASFSLEIPVYRDQVKLDLVHNVLRPGGVWGSYRFLALAKPKPRCIHHSQGSQITHGDLTSLRWVEGPIRPGAKNQSTVNVYYGSLNFRDIMMGTGKLARDVVVKKRIEQNSLIGFEFSGIDTATGRRVMGMRGNGALANICDMSGNYLQWVVPNEWTLEDAATVPVVYATCISALYLSGDMKKGDKILIHAGSGGVGQAAITLALHEGCEVFTTVGTPEKREFIKNHFPQIDDNHIGNSRDTSFEQFIYAQTQGRGVDLALNSLAEEKLLATVRCLAPGGRFLEIGKFDLASNNPLGMEAFLKGISFHSIQLDTLFSAPPEDQKIMYNVVEKVLRAGAIRPLVRTVFRDDQLEEAFRYMATGKHIGKVLIKVRDEDNKDEKLYYGLPNYYCFDDRSYLVHGGLGGFGLELADWLVLRGAKRLALTSRNGPTNGYQKSRIHTWRSYGVQVKIITGKDAATEEGCKAILEETAALAPVDGIFNLAVVLRDSLFANQTVESFEESLNVKATATKLFDKFSRSICPNLRHFVVFSSVSCGRGNAGQTNYGMANSIMERLCEKRVAENLPALAVEWGAVGDVGLVAEMLEDNTEVVIGGTLRQGINSCLQELEGFLIQDSPVVSSMVVAEKKVGSAGSMNIIESILYIMGLKDLKTISQHTSLSELGMDSMMAVEIKQTLEREFEVFLTPQEIRNLNFAKIIEISTQKTDTNKEEPENIPATRHLADIRMLMKTLGTTDVCSEVCLPLKTKQETGRSEVFVLPGIEGSHTIFEHLSGKLKAPTTCLQLGTASSESESIDGIADFLLPHVKTRTKNQKDFLIAGYSFGSIVAIELARRLESEGLNGRLVLIDGAPDYLRNICEKIFAPRDDDDLQNNVLIGIVSTLAPSACKELASLLPQRKTWEEKLDICLKAVPSQESISFSEEFQRSTCTAIYKRIKAVYNYDTRKLSPIKASIVLLRLAQASVSISEDYGLRALTSGTVDVHLVEGDHLTIVDNEICALAINGDPITSAKQFELIKEKDERLSMPPIISNVITRN